MRHIKIEKSFVCTGCGNQLAANVPTGRMGEKTTLADFLSKITIDPCKECASQSPRKRGQYRWSDGE